MRITFVIIIGLILLVPAASPAWGQEKGTEKLVLVLDTPVIGTIKAGRSSQRVEGRLVVEADGTVDEMEQGVLNVRRTNLILYKFDQSSLGGNEKDPVGPISFFLNPSSRSNRFKYDSRSGVITAELPGRTHYKAIDEILGYQRNQKDEFLHDFPSFTQTSAMSLEIALGEKLPGTNNDQTKVEGKISAAITAQPLDEAKLPEISIELSFRTPPIFIIIWHPYWRIVRTLPIQPIRVRTSAADGSPSGTSYNPLIIGARTEWNKAGIIFEERAFQTVTSATLKTYSDGEQGSMFALYNSTDAVEIFYAAAFSPVSLYGGGATWSSGTAAAKVITSDGNDNGVDLTHLAHELGHVLTLGHPGSGYPTGSVPHMYDGSAGTLMCPSGYLRDNPARQSDDNTTNANNPLLRLTVTIGSGPATDCSGDPSCGSCAAHMD